MPKAWLWSLLAVLAIIGTVMWRFHGIDRTDTSEAAAVALRETVLIVTAVTGAMALLAFVLWPRLAFAMLLYAIPARATVVALTWLAKHQGWDSHYTKFGPQGLERDMHETLVSAAMAQFGFWVPLTVVIGTCMGCVFAGRRRA